MSRISSAAVVKVAELTKHTTRVCPIECKAGETLKGETCVADAPEVIDPPDGA